MKKEEVKDIQATVDEKVDTVKPENNVEKTISQLADEVMRGVHGSGRERMIVLGDKYEAVQKEVNKRIKGIK